mgnify:CR=1 FL=1
MKPTIYDVAKEAGVSIATVSKVMNNQRVGQKSKEKVLQAMEKLNYKPSVLASALTGKQTSTIGFLLPDLANPFIAEMARRVEDRAYERGYNLVICSTDFEPDKEAFYVSLLKQKSVDGFIIAGGFKHIEVVTQLLEEQFPVVLLGESYPSLSINSVKVDDFIGGYEVASFLISLGHKKIAVIGEEASSSRERIRGYEQALHDHNLPINKRMVMITSHSNVENVERVAGELLDQEAPTAIFACNDILAIGVILAARERKLQIPKDLSIVGFDNTFLSRSSDPPLTTVKQPIQDLCFQAFDMLIEEIKGESKYKQRVVLLPELIVRKSTGAPPAKL